MSRFPRKTPIAYRATNMATNVQMDAALSGQVLHVSASCVHAQITLTKDQNAALRDAGRL